MQLHIVISALTFLLMMMVNPVARAANWVISDLGTLGGTISYPTAINRQGQVVGASYLPGNLRRHAFLYANGSMIDLGTLGGTHSEATAINDAGTVTGFSDAQGDLSIGAFLYRANVLQAIGTLPGVAPQSHAYGINNAEQVVGMSSDGNAQAGAAPFQAFLYRNGGMSALSAAASAAVGINASGQAVGYVMTAAGAPGTPGVYDMPDVQHAALFSRGQTIDLGTLDGFAGNSRADAINNAGEIVGASAVDHDPSSNHAFFYNRVRMIDLGTLPGFSASEATGINNASLIVGTSSQGLVTHGFLYQKGRMIDLSLLPEALAAGWRIVDARAINDAGQIVGTGLINGESHAYLLTPVVNQNFVISMRKENALHAR